MDSVMHHWLLRMHWNYSVFDHRSQRLDVLISTNR